jgi:DNA-binding transcriptional ArsR family regulator
MAVRAKRQTWEHAARLAAQIAPRFEAAADPSRVGILMVLAEGEMRLTAAAEELEITPKLASYHMRELRDAGMVDGQRLGMELIYSIAESGRGMMELINELMLSVPAAATAR